MHDKNGRAYLTVERAKPGLKIEVDGSFECVEPGSVHVLKCDSSDGDLYFKCENGSHCIDGQIDLDDTHYVGIYPAE